MLLGLTSLCLFFPLFPLSLAGLGFLWSHLFVFCFDCLRLGVGDCFMHSSAGLTLTLAMASMFELWVLFSVLLESGFE